MKHILFILLFASFIACSSRKKANGADDRTVKAVLLNSKIFLLTTQSTDSTYGFSAQNPVKVGGIKNNEAVLNEQRFLNALLGPNGELTKYWRLGSCCPFATPNGLVGDMGMLDHYKMVYVGGKDTADIYINMYDEGNLYIPVGFTARKK